MSWESTTFGAVFDIQLGKMLDKEKNVGDLRPYLANRDVRWGECDVSNLGEMRFTAEDRKKYELRPGDLLVCEGGEVGRTAIWNGDLSGCYYQKAIHRLRSNGAVEPRFVMHYMRWAADRKLFARLTSATSIAHLTKAKLQKLPLPLPPIAEQKRIAGILDSAEALRAKRQESIDALHSLIESIFLDTFGDPVTNPMGWPTTTLPDIATKFTDGPFGSNLKSSHYAPNGVRVIRLQNVGIGELLDDDVAFISHEHFASLPRNHCKPGDVIVATLGDPNLRACIVPERLPQSLNKADCLLLRVDSDKAESSYVCWLLNCRATVAKARELVRGQTRGRISLGRLKELRVPLPPRDLQSRFSVMLRVIEKQSVQQRDHLAGLDTLFASLQSRGFRGDL